MKTRNPRNKRHPLYKHLNAQPVKLIGSGQVSNEIYQSRRVECESLSVSPSEMNFIQDVRDGNRVNRNDSEGK